MVIPLVARLAFNIAKKSAKSLLTGKKKSAVSKKTKEKLKEKKKKSQKKYDKGIKKYKKDQEKKLKSDKGVDKEEYWDDLTDEDQAEELAKLRRKTNFMNN